MLQAPKNICVKKIFQLKIFSGKTAFFFFFDAKEDKLWRF